MKEFDLGGQVAFISGTSRGLGRPGEETDLDGALISLASESSRYMTGQTQLIDSGISTGCRRAMPFAPAQP